MAHWEHEARRLYEENVRLKGDQESLIAERGQIARAAGAAEARADRLAKALRGEVVSYSVGNKYSAVCHSLCGLCEARGDEDEEPPHKDDCPLFGVT